MKLTILHTLLLFYLNIASWFYKVVDKWHGFTIVHTMHTIKLLLIYFMHEKTSTNPVLIPKEML